MMSPLETGKKSLFQGKGCTASMQPRKAEKVYNAGNLKVVLTTSAQTVRYVRFITYFS